MNFRKLLFRILKKKEYQSINRKYIEIKNNIHSPSKLNSEKTNEFLSFVIEHSSYYRNFNTLELTDFPILTKDILKKNIEDIITVDKNSLDNYPFMTTSGSYGTPFKFYVSKEKRLTQQAEVLYFGLLSNFDIGTKHIYCRAINPSLKNQIIKNQYILKPEKIDKGWIIDSIKKMQKLKPEVIISYPSTLNNIAMFMNEYKLSIKGVSGIITIGEGMKDDAAENIQKAFGINPYSRYSTEELGVLGNYHGDQSKILVNQVNFLVEVLNDNNEPVAEGETGKVIVTDFTSTVTPLIRYDTGDLAKVSKYKEGLVYQIDHLEGRKIETIYTTEGKALTPFIINGAMRTYEDVLQFQFIQHSKTDYELKVLPINLEKHESYDRALNLIKDSLGEDAEIKLSIVPEIETLKSGKRPYIINLYRKE